MNKIPYSENIFNISETPIPASDGCIEEEDDALKIIEQDIRGLMYRLADANIAIEESQKEFYNEKKRLLLSIIEILDAFDRVFLSIQKKKDAIDRQMKKWIANFRTIRRMLSILLTEQGISVMETLGQDFDPRWHRISETVVDESKSDGDIVEEVQKGYFWSNQLLRKAEIIIVKNNDPS